MHEKGIVGKYSQCDRVQMRESSSNTYWDVLLHFYSVAYTRDI